jgi:hypothetical protein
MGGCEATRPRADFGGSMQIMNIAEVVTKRSQVEKEIKETEDAHKGRMADLNLDLEELKRLQAIHAEGFDLGRVQRAEKHLRIRGAYWPTKERISAIDDAIVDLANGGRRLALAYFGVKNYEGFGDQREDHRRGYGPKHGYIVFAVERKHSTELSPEDIDACIYYLEQVKKGSLKKED